MPCVDTAIYIVTVQANTMCNSYQERCDLPRPDYSWFGLPVLLLSIPAMGRLSIPATGRLSISAMGRCG